MRRHIHLQEEQHDVTLHGRPGDWRLQVGDGPPLPVDRTPGPAMKTVLQLGDDSAAMRIAVKGETAYIRAFDRTFTLSVVDPVEQAAQQTGRRANSANAPMPGVVVEIKAAVGDRVVRGQPLMIIESMKILTVISAPRDGRVGEIHFEPGQSFDKNAALVTLGDS
ncbi:MAG: acetyl-CoA carboxylase biotin carboxyl carrier protein subunit [Deltaproteobacteria bacterium]|nr:acetyl-CoA carboxylase biotin carboxyl carrier protein subunit [Deltaproteobacteria bacterium]